MDWETKGLGNRHPPWLGWKWGIVRTACRQAFSGLCTENALIGVPAPPHFFLKKVVLLLLVLLFFFNFYFLALCKKHWSIGVQQLCFSRESQNKVTVLDVRTLWPVGESMLRICYLKKYLLAMYDGPLLWSQHLRNWGGRRTPRMEGQPGLYI